jgi:hypothetical protein
MFAGARKGKAGEEEREPKAVRLLREVLATADDLAGRPMWRMMELDRRRVHALANRATEPEQPKAAPPREAAPVMLYCDGKDHRTRRRMEELLAGRDIAFQVLDVSEDESTRAWALHATKLTEMPLCFIAGAPVGGLHELMQLDVNGELHRRVFGVER